MLVQDAEESRTVFHSRSAELPADTVNSVGDWVHWSGRKGTSEAGVENASNIWVARLINGQPAIIREPTDGGDWPPMYYQ
jgi:hypothetical protein